MGLFGPSPRQRRSGCLSPRLIIAVVIAGASLFAYFGRSQLNPVTGQKQHVGSISPETEIALGLQAAPDMMKQYGGELPDPAAQRIVDRVGERLRTRSKITGAPYRFDYHLLADGETINAFALPGGQVFITYGLMRRLGTEAQLAGVLGHEMGHVVARHGAQQLAKQQLTQGLTGAAVLASYDPNNPSSRGSAAVAVMIGQLVNLRYGREDELEADRLGVQFMAEAGYDPHAMIGVMKVLEEASKGRAPPEFFSTHPNPEHRTERIQEAITKAFPKGVPEGLEK